MTIHEHDGDNAQELEAAAPQPLGPEEQFSEEEFAEEVRDLVASSVPRVFALVEERGERADGRILYWGLAFDEEDCADDEPRTIVISASSHLRGGSFSSAEAAQQIFSRRRKVRLVWTSTPATHPADTIAS